MIKLQKTAVSFEIFGKSEILGKFVPTAHGTFATWHEANAHAEKNMPTVHFQIQTVTASK